MNIYNNERAVLKHGVRAYHAEARILFRLCLYTIVKGYLADDLGVFRSSGGTVSRGWGCGAFLPKDRSGYGVQGCGTVPWCSA